MVNSYNFEVAVRAIAIALMGAELPVIAGQQPYATGHEPGLYFWQLDSVDAGAVGRKYEAGKADYSTFRRVTYRVQAVDVESVEAVRLTNRAKLVITSMHFADALFGDTGAGVYSTSGTTVVYRENDLGRMACTSFFDVTFSIQQRESLPTPTITGVTGGLDGY